MKMQIVHDARHKSHRATHHRILAWKTRYKFLIEAYNEGGYPLRFPKKPSRIVFPEKWKISSFPENSNSQKMIPRKKNPKIQFPQEKIPENEKNKKMQLKRWDCVWWLMFSRDIFFGISFSGNKFSGKKCGKISFRDYFFFGNSEGSHEGGFGKVHMWIDIEMKDTQNSYTITYLF